jgi:hypothetical protein
VRTPGFHRHEKHGADHDENTLIAGGVQMGPIVLSDELITVRCDLETGERYRETSSTLHGIASRSTIASSSNASGRWHRRPASEICLRPTRRVLANNSSGHSGARPQAESSNP